MNFVGPQAYPTVLNAEHFYAFGFLYLNTEHPHTSQEVSTIKFKRTEWKALEQCPYQKSQSEDNVTSLMNCQRPGCCKKKRWSLLCSQKPDAWPCGAVVSGGKQQRTVKQLMAPDATVILDVVPLPQQVNTAPGTQHAAVSLENAFSIS